MRIWISNRQRKMALNPERIKKRAGKILNALGWSEAELSLTILGDRAMARLNRETFGRRGPTNVIAFPLDAPPLASAGDGPAREIGAPLPLAALRLQVQPADGPGRGGHLPGDHR